MFYAQTTSNSLQRLDKNRLRLITFDVSVLRRLVIGQRTRSRQLVNITISLPTGKTRHTWEVFDQLGSQMLSKDPPKYFPLLATRLEENRKPTGGKPCQDSRLRVID